jgi:anti-sigma regulatory factor (Ser/Thr protein kinase)
MITEARPQPIDLPPDPECLIQSLRSIGYTLETALADLIDNSIAADASEISIRFSWNNGTPWVALADNGTGMDREMLIKAMRFGSRSPKETRAPNDLGRFGLGLKTASISQCRKLSVISWRKENVSAFEWNLDLFSDGWKLHHVPIDELEKNAFVHTYRSNNTQSGTIVYWQHIDSLGGENGLVDSEDDFSEAMVLASDHLSLIFHRFIAPGPGKKGIRILFNEMPLEAHDPFNKKNNATQELPLQELPLSGASIKIQPYILPHRNKVSREEYNKHAGPKGYFNHQGFYVYRSDRLIIQGTWFRLRRREEISKYIRIQIDIPNSLDEQWRLDVLKSTATPPPAVRENLKSIIGKIEDRGRQVYLSRGRRLKSKADHPFWNRTISNNKVKYTINREHPAILGAANREGNQALLSLLKLIESAFPYEMAYTDCANGIEKAQIESDTDSSFYNAALNLAQLLREGADSDEAFLEDLPHIEPFNTSKQLQNWIIAKMHLRNETD